MRPTMIVAVFVVGLQANISAADFHQIVISTGFNETSLTSGLNRSTAMSAKFHQGRQLYTTSFDTRGLVSLGLGRISEALDSERQSWRIPSLTVFGGPEMPPGLECKFHAAWYSLVQPTAKPAKWITPIFSTEVGAVWQHQHAPKVRVTHRFTTYRHRRSSRSQGVEWVWEFGQDFPTGQNQSSADNVTNTTGPIKTVHVQRLRRENWIFFSREAGPGMARLNIGVTEKEVIESAGRGDSDLIQRIQRGAGPHKRQVVVLMLRIEYVMRRWF